MFNLDDWLGLLSYSLYLEQFVALDKENLVFKLVDLPDDYTQKWELIEYDKWNAGIDKQMKDMPDNISRYASSYHGVLESLLVDDWGVEKNW